MLKQENQNQTEFSKLGIAMSILDLLSKIGLTVPTPIQRKSIPIAIGGKDLIGIAQTGTGKTFAYGIPMVQRIALYKGLGLILLPTRELALQVEESLRKLGGVFGLKTVVLIGGMPIGQQIHDLRRRPHIMIATPGRMMDIMKRRIIKPEEIKILVLDEADMMLDMGFLPQIEEILKQIPKLRQTLLFSATMPTAIVRLATAHMSLPVNIEIAPAGTTVEQVDQEMHIVKKEDKLSHLEKILSQHAGSVLIFSRTKHGAKALANAVQTMGHKAAEIHSNRSFYQRREAMDGFRSKKYRILVATDIAARGIDVSGIELVVNYDLPDSSEDYVHRIGRTARAGKHGKAISFATPSQGRDIRNIERLIKKNLPLTKIAELDKPITHPRPSNRYGRTNSYGRSSFSPRSNSGSAKPYHAFNKTGDDKRKQFAQTPVGRPSSRPSQQASSSRSGARPFRPSAPKPRPMLFTDKQRFRASMQKPR